MKKRTAIDMGASMVRVLPRGEGMEQMVDCPSAAALECVTGKPLCYGYDAKQTSRRMPGSVDVVYPLLEPESVTSTVLEGLFGCAAEFAHPSGRLHGDLVLALPGIVGEEQEEAYPEAASVCGAKDVFVIGGLYAASRGVALAPDGYNLVCHVGASAAEIGIFLHGECLDSRVVAMGGHAFDDLLGDYIYDQHAILLDAEGAEDAKLRLSQLPKEEKTLTVSGIHRKTGLPRTAELEAQPLRAVLAGAFSYFTDPISEMVAQLGEMPTYAVLAGGSAPLCGLAEAIGACLPDCAVEIAPDPANAVIRGLYAIMESGELDQTDKQKRKKERT